MMKIKLKRKYACDYLQINFSSHSCGCLERQFFALILAHFAKVSLRIFSEFKKARPIISFITDGVMNTSSYLTFLRSWLAVHLAINSKLIVELIS
mmetsp:Transcript_38995/g.51423  ORF Transcript_38995/g.51423 Transcript_38995/m.51423 type:complete len:95 (-) Transcript_38995:137-421(-)